jgi:uncharacterized protein (TIGR02678 family)
MNHEVRESARFLLGKPLVVAALEPNEHRRIRRNSDELTSMFRTYLGYRLTVDARLARLYKAGLGSDSTRPLTVKTSKAPFSPRDYTYLALVCSVLFSVGQQVLLSSLVSDVEQAAAEAGVALSQGTRTERLGLVHALRQLIEWGALVEEDGSVSGYAEMDTTEALLTIERDVVRELLATSLRDVASPGGLVRLATDVAPEAVRHRVRRRLVECPVVMLDDLPEAERTWLRQSQRREAHLLEENFGLSLEIRSEGVAAFDPRDELSDLFFPRDGTTAQAALLTVSALAGEALVGEGASAPAAPSSAGAPLPPTVPLRPGALRQVVARLLARHTKSWAKEYAGRPERLARDVEELLAAMGLLTRGTGGELSLRAVAARYAPESLQRATNEEALPATTTSDPQAFALEAP